MAIINKETNKYIKIDQKNTFLSSDGLHIVYTVYNSKEDRASEKFREKSIKDFYSNLKKYNYENPNGEYYNLCRIFLDEYSLSYYKLLNIGIIKITPFSIFNKVYYGFGLLDPGFNNFKFDMNVLSKDELKFLKSKGFAEEWAKYPVKIDSISIACIKDSEAIHYPFNISELYKYLKTGIESSEYHYIYDEDTDNLIDDL